MAVALLLLVSALASTPPTEPIRHCTGACQRASQSSLMRNLRRLKTAERDLCDSTGHCPQVASPLASHPCVDGMADEYPCEGVDLLSFVPLRLLGGGPDSEGSDVWGWSGSINGTQRSLALFCATDGSSIIDVTQPTTPAVVGWIPSHLNEESIWRDIKTYQHYMFIVSECPRHGMQVYDLTKTPAASAGAPPHLAPHARYTEFGSAHNIFINEATGFAYAVGTTTCDSGLHMVDLTHPLKPTFAGCATDVGYIHDVQCVVYDKGPDLRYRNHEICFAFVEDSFAILDVTDKKDVHVLSRVFYKGVAYAHQGWLFRSQRYMLGNDELDEVEEVNDGHTLTFVWDVADLEAPRVMEEYHSPVVAIDHNLYIDQALELAFEANYEAGLRVLDTSGVGKPSHADRVAATGSALVQVAYFDVHPEGNTINFFGSWSVYQGLPEGVMVVSSIERGLFVLRLQEKVTEAAEARVKAM